MHGESQSRSEVLVDARRAGLRRVVFAKKNTDIQYYGGGHRWLSAVAACQCSASSKTMPRKKVAQTGLTKILGIRTEFPQSALKSAVGLWNTTHIPRNAWMTAAPRAFTQSAALRQTESFEF